MLSASAYPALVLNADFRPLSWCPLSKWPWREAVHAVLLGRVDVLREYERTVRSPTHEMRLPSVVVLREYQSLSRLAPLTRFNLTLRDEWRCQYCHQLFATEDLTFDHLIPKSRGGLSTYQNLVLACRQCNNQKANLMPEAAKKRGLWPARMPRHPTLHELNEIGRRHPPDQLHSDWMDVLYWDGELEP